MDESEQPRQQGFGHSRKRVVGEVALIVAVVVGLVLAGLWLVRGLAGWASFLVPTSVDVALGAQSWAALTPSERRCDNEQTQRYVQTIAGALTPHIQSAFDFQFVVADDDAINAFALPGGFVTVNMGLLRAAGSGEEVAGVIAHELAHVTERHGTKRILRGLGSMALMSVAFGGTDIEAPTALVAGLVNTSYDRDQEAEADQVGLALLERAEVDPRGMARFFERVQNEAGAAIPELLSTHPDPGNRAALAAARAENATISVNLPAPTGLRCH